jgi:hypothetical protein
MCVPKHGDTTTGVGEPAKIGADLPSVTVENRTDTTVAKDLRS